MASFRVFRQPLMYACLCGGALVLGLWTGSSLAGGQAAIPGEAVVEPEGHMHAELRVYSDHTGGVSDYETIGLGALDGRLTLPADRIPEDARLALVGWDQTDATLRRILDNVVLIGSPDDAWFLPSRDEEREIPRLRITDALDNPLPWKDLAVTILFHQKASLIFDDGHPMPEELAALHIAIVDKDEAGRPLLPTIVRMPRRAPHPVAITPRRLNDMRGRFLGTVAMWVHHPDYGTAGLDHRYRLGVKDTIRVPLVRQGTEEAARAFAGWVVDRDTETPVEDAVIRCDHVRTPGEGLINVEPRCVRTGPDGHFRYYPVPNDNRSNERGALMPVHCRGEMKVWTSQLSDLLPETQSVYNDAPATIEMRKGQAFHTFAFVRNSRQLGADQIENIRLYYTLPNQNRPRYQLPRSYLTDGGTIPHGTYVASFLGGFAQDTHFLPLDVNEQSPRELVFTPKEGCIYEGRVVHGIDGRPFAKAFVLAYSGTVNDRHMGMLTEQDWDNVDQSDNNPRAREDAIKRLEEMYSFEDLVQTDDQGHYQLALGPGQTTHSLLFFARDFVPFKVPVHALNSEDGTPANVADVQLYPAAFVTITPQAEPVHDGHLSIMPRWIIDPNDNPDWALEMIPWVNWRHQNLGQFSYDPWLAVDRPNRIYVPAGVLLKLSLRAPYDEPLCTTTVPTEICLEQGRHLDLGQWTLPAAQLYIVRVLGPDGHPVEGLPLRQARWPRQWGVAHNTDELGDVYFHADRGSKVSVSVAASDVSRPTPPGPRHLNIWTFDLSQAQGDPPIFERTISAELVRAFRENPLDN